MLKNTSGQIICFHMYDASDGSDVITGSPTVYVLKDGGAQATGTGAKVSEGQGVWSYAPSASETNASHVAFTMVLAGSLSQTINVYPSTIDYTDGVRAGLTALPNAAADAAGGLPISDAGGLDMDALATSLTTIDTNVDAILDDTGTSGVVIATATQDSIVDKVWDEPKAGHTTADTYGAYLDQSISSTTTGGVTADAIADAVWTEVLSAHTGVAGGAAEALDAASSGGGLDAAGVRAAIGLASANLDTQLSTIDNEIATIDANVDAILEDTGTTIPASLTTIDNEIAVIDTEVGAMQLDVTAILEDTGTTIPASLTTIDDEIAVIDANVDAILVDTATIGTPAGASVSADIAALQADIDAQDALMTSLNNNSTSTFANVQAILDDTNELQTDWAVGGRLELTLSAVGAPLDAAGIRTAIGLATANLDTQLAGIDTDVAAILVDTDTSIPTLIAAAEAKIDIVDTNVDAILVDTDATLPTTLTSIEGKVDQVLEDTGTTLPATLVTIDSEIGVIDANVDAILVDTGTTLSSQLTTIDANVDAILVDTGTTIPASLTTIDNEIAVIDTEVGLMQLDVTSIETKVDTIDTEVGAMQLDVTAILEDTSTTLPTDISAAGISQADVRAAVGLANADLDAQLATLGGNFGNGANTVTITVQEDVGSTPLQFASVRVTAGATTIVGTTDAAGEIAFALDSGTWDVNVSAFGYSSLVSQSLVVSGVTTETYQLTLTSTIPLPASPNVATGVLTAFDQYGQVEQDVDFEVKLTAGPGIVGQSHDTEGRVFTSAPDGLVTCTNLIKFATYTIKRSSGTTQTFVVPDASSFTIPVTGLLGFEPTP